MGLISELLFVRISEYFEYENTGILSERWEKVDTVYMKNKSVVIVTEVCAWCFRSANDFPICLPPL